jgi:acid stress-induced BolA-like protein IbaG/YrbA
MHEPWLQRSQHHSNSVPARPGAPPVCYAARRRFTKLDSSRGGGSRGAPRRRNSVKAAEVKSRIEAGLPGSRASVRSDDDTHFEAVVIAAQFNGQRPLKRHQQVYATLGDAVGREIHALSIEALTPEEWSARGGT